jgi:deoxyribonuclease V
MHSWNLTPKEAIQLQRKLKDQVKTHLTLRNPQHIAGVDVAYIREKEQSVATVVVVSCADFETVESAVAKMKTPFPYIPGLLSFREIPAILKALEKLSNLPDLILVDGHGQAHPRRFGIAAHLGLWLKHPTIGIGKSRLCGEFRQPGKNKGSCTDLIHKGEVIGRVLRTRTGVQPVFVSVGYGLPLKECVHWTLAMTPRFRLPEPIRRADRLSHESKGI